MTKSACLENVNDGAMCYDYYVEPEALMPATLGVKTIHYTDSNVDNLHSAMEGESTDGYCDTTVESLNEVSNQALCESSVASNIGYKYTIDFPSNGQHDFTFTLPADFKNGG